MPCGTGKIWGRGAEGGGGTEATNAWTTEDSMVDGTPFSTRILGPTLNLSPAAAASWLAASASACTQREFFIDNLLVRIEMTLVDRHGAMGV